MWRNIISKPKTGQKGLISKAASIDVSNAYYSSKFNDYPIYEKNIAANKIFESLRKTLTINNEDIQNKICFNCNEEETSVYKYIEGIREINGRIVIGCSQCDNLYNIYLNNDNQWVIKEVD